MSEVPLYPATHPSQDSNWTLGVDHLGVVEIIQLTYSLPDHSCVPLLSCRPSERYSDKKFPVNDSSVGVLTRLE